MTLAKIIDTLKMISLKHPNVNSAYEGNIYDILNAPDNRYASVVITQQSHTTDEIYDHYGFVIFYVDRLVDDLEENRVQIQSIGKSMLGNIITAFCNEFEAECDNISYQTFTQRFADETAGVYCTITIDTVKDVYCAERYWDESWSAPIVSIKNVDMSITFTENGHYTLDYDPTIYTGIGKVDIDVNVDVDSYYNRGYGVGYDEGKEDGAIEQKAKLESINITENGTYSREDGYNSITVEVPDLNGSYEEGYNQGYAEGEQASYNTGYEQGQADVAANARVLDVTENGSYYSEFSDDIYIYPDHITGDFGDGNYFYDWGEIKGGCYNTKIPFTLGTRIEFWWKAAEKSTGDSWFPVLGAGLTDNTTFEIRHYYTDRSRLQVKCGSDSTLFIIDKDIWNHFVFENNTLYLNDEVIVTFSNTFTSDSSPILINSTPYCADGRYADGLFGMVKINDSIFIPKDGGFVNYHTNEQLGGYVKPNDATYDYIESDQITGYFDDGTPFYGYAVLNKAYFNTNVIPDNDTNLELWWKDDGVSLMYNTIIGTQQDGKGSDGIIKFCEYTNSQNRWEFDAKNGLFPRDNNWHHLVLNKTAFYYDGEKYADVNGSLKTTNVPIVINGLGFNPDVNHISNGYFGMVKIDGKTFIPTENGYVDIDTQELLPSNWIIEGADIPFKGQYVYTENEVIHIVPEGPLYKTVNVNIKPKISVAKEGLKFGHSTFKEIPEWADFEGVTDMGNMFYNCGSLENVRYIDTSSVTNMYWCFYGCGNIKHIATLDTSNVTNMGSFCEDCGQLIEFPPLNTSKVTNMREMFHSCNSLKKVPALDARSVVRQNYGIFGSSNLNNLTDFGGLIGLKASMDGNYGFEKVPNLTYESCINILNGLYDFVGNGETPASNEGKLKVHSNFLTTVGDEIAIATNKGWQITA